MERYRNFISLICAAILVLPGGLVVTNAASDAGWLGPGVFLILPGLLISMAFGNVHSFSSWLAIIIAFAFWASILWLLLGLVLRRRRKANART